MRPGGDLRCHGQIRSGGEATCVIAELLGGYLLLTLYLLLCPWTEYRAAPNDEVMVCVAVADYRYITSKQVPVCQIRVV